jgi:hypothetical protein
VSNSTAHAAAVARLAAAAKGVKLKAKSPLSALNFQL